MNKSENTDNTDKEAFENILVLNDIVEAGLMENLLSEEGLSFYVRPWRDVSFSGICTDRKGYGWLMGRTEDEEKIRTIYTERIGTQDD
jgi:hypothetical protein